MENSHKIMESCKTMLVTSGYSHVDVWNYKKEKIAFSIFNVHDLYTNFLNYIGKDLIISGGMDRSIKISSLWDRKKISEINDMHAQTIINVIPIHRSSYPFLASFSSDASLTLIDPKLNFCGKSELVGKIDIFGDIFNNARIFNNMNKYICVFSLGSSEICGVDVKQFESSRVYRNDIELISGEKYLLSDVDSDCESIFLSSYCPSTRIPMIVNVCPSTYKTRKTFRESQNKTLEKSIIGKSVTSVRCTKPHGKYVFCGTSSGDVYMFDQRKENEEILRFPAHDAESIRRICVLSENLIATLSAYSGDYIHVWKIKGSKMKKSRESGYKIFARSLCVGGAAAGIAKTVVSPLERFKVILQTQANHPDIAPELRFRGIFDCATGLWKRQLKGRSFFVKPLVYWRGNSINVVRYFPMQSISFAFKARFRRVLFKRESYSVYGNAWRSMLAGGLAGVTGLTFCYPLDYARTRISTDVGTKRKYKGMFDCMLRSVKEGGVKTLYRGYGASVVGVFPYRACYFGGYDLMKKYIMNDHPEKVSFWYRWACSQSVAVSSQYITYPFDTVKRRVQVSSASEQVYKSSWDCFRKILAEEGWLGFYKGALTNAVRGTGCALVLVFYDDIGRFLFLDKLYGSK